MTVIVETGAGNPAANSYASVAEATAYHSHSTSLEAWDNIDLDAQGQRLVAATRRLDTMFDWFGEPMRWGQPLGFPRRGLVNSYGRPVYISGVPMSVKVATISLALWLPDPATVAAVGATGEDPVEEINLGPIGLKFSVPDQSSGSPASSLVYVPTDIILLLREVGEYVGGGIGVGRLVR